MSRNVVAKPSPKSSYCIGARANVDLGLEPRFLKKNEIDSLDLLISCRHGWESPEDSNSRRFCRLKSVLDARGEGDQGEERGDAFFGREHKFVHWIHVLACCHGQQEPARPGPEIQDVLHGIVMAESELYRS